MTERADPQLAAAYHIETAIGATIDAMRRTIRAVETLDLDKLVEARDRLSAAESSLTKAVETRQARDDRKS